MLMFGSACSLHKLAMPNTCINYGVCTSVFPLGVLFRV